MILHSMTATFGKLDHQTLTLEPGLNVIQGPNEWGKSTWCAFLTVMLYGLDTRARTTQAGLADKEHYAPWSGQPMAGRLELTWEGRRITITRERKGRVPLGQFRAYETETGLDIPELDGTNCGQVLLGVERSVFQRTGRISLKDMPVTDDEALRRRLNALVTTGEEDSGADQLGKKLKELKNQCDRPRSGLPYLRQRHQEILHQQEQWEKLECQLAQGRQRQKELEDFAAWLDNHAQALGYARAQADRQRVRQAEAARDALAGELTQCRAMTRELPDRAQAEGEIARLQSLQTHWASLEMEEQMLPQPPVPPEGPEAFRGKTGGEALAEARRDAIAWQTARNDNRPVLLVLALVLGGIALGLAWLAPQLWLLAGTLGIGSGVMVTIWALRRSSGGKTMAALEGIYGSLPPEGWEAAARDYEALCQAYERELADYQTSRGDLDSRKARLRQALAEIPPERNLAYWQDTLRTWDRLYDLERQLRQAQAQVETLTAMAQVAQPPAFPDTMTYDLDQTRRLKSDTTQSIHQLQRQMGVLQGQREQLDSPETLARKCRETEAAIYRLEQTKAAVEMALQTLADTQTELQRRFAPKIARQAREDFTALTQGRYDRLTLDRDLRLQAGLAGEESLRTAQWPSDGTVDQLYLALRLAAWDVLSPNGLLILDDALVRFDDGRARAALELLKEQGRRHQILLFTCHRRERQWL